MSVLSSSENPPQLRGFLGGVFLTQIVDSALHLAQPLLLAKISGSMGGAAFFSAFDTGVHMAGTYLGGWPTDRFGARRVLVVSTFLRAVVLAWIPIMMIGGFMNLWLAMGCYTLEALIRGFVDASVHTVPLELARHRAEELDRINSRYELSFDPTLTQKTNLLDRLETLERRIMSYAQSGVKMPEEVKRVLTKELELLSALVSNTHVIQNTDSFAKGAKQGSAGKKDQGGVGSYADRPTTHYTRATYDDRIQSGTMPVGSGFSLFAGTPNDNPDVRVRPGFAMTTDQIRHRGSAAAFNTQAVGGADYKKRSEELCRQIRGAGIGTPADFGCIENPSEVSANYSWKGNYSMVCSRLGNQWGSWYPEMFGCPKYNPDDQYNGSLL